MPVMYKKRVRKDFLVNVLREAFLTRDDAALLYERIFDAVYDELKKGNAVNLFGLVEVRPIFKPGKKIKTAFSDGEIEVEDRIGLTSKIYSTLNRVWRIEHDPQYREMSQKIEEWYARQNNGKSTRKRKGRIKEALGK